MKIKADELAAKLTEILNQYQDATTENMKQAVDKVAKKVEKKLHSDSPKRTGAYARSWAVKKDPSVKQWSYTKIVYAKDPHYRLTHLLEKGHRKVNGGFVAARPHIAKVEQEAIEELVKEIKNDA